MRGVFSYRGNEHDDVGLAVALIESAEPMDTMYSMLSATVIVKPVVVKAPPPLSSIVVPLPASRELARFKPLV